MSKGTEKGQHREDLGEAQYLDLESREQGRATVTLERVAGDFILRTMGSLGEILRRRGGW